MEHTKSQCGAYKCLGGGGGGGGGNYLYMT